MNSDLLLHVAAPRLVRRVEMISLQGSRSRIMSKDYRRIATPVVNISH
jgi:hypothetical protein